VERTTTSSVGDSRKSWKLRELRARSMGSSRTKGVTPVPIIGGRTISTSRLSVPIVRLDNLNIEVVRAYREVNNLNVEVVRVYREVRRPQHRGCPCLS
jgi:hypothetical protein